MKYFLITALPKSGTTWVQRACGAHPEIHCRAEDQFTKSWAGIQSLIQDYNALIEMRDRQRDHQGIDPLTTLDTAKLFFAMVKIALDKAPAPVRWSGIKDVTIGASGFLKLIPLTHIINVIRDPRDIALSAWAHRRRIGEAAADASALPSMEFLTTTATLWRKQHALIKATEAEAPGRSFDIRYEDLSGDFTATIHGLLVFLDVARDPEILADLRAKTSFHQLSGGRTPGEEDGNSFFRKGVAGGWRDVLTPEQVAVFAGICGDDLRARGYALE